MKFSAHVYFGGATATPEAIATVARSLEDCGFHAAWVPEHVVLFREHASHYPYTEDGSFPMAAEVVPIDPFLVLTYVAAQTSHMRLGTGIVIVPQRNPVYTAKQVADVDVLSNGRFDFGIGVGWLKEEFDALQVPFAHRGARADEYIEVMKTLWRETEASYEGRFYQLSKAVQGPKPVQTPHPPIYVGGESDAALKRVARLGQGWFGVNRSLEEISALLQKLDGYLAECGRRRADIQVAFSPYSHPFDQDTAKRYQDLGIDEVVLGVWGRSAEEMRATAERLAEHYISRAAA